MQVELTSDAKEHILFWQNTGNKSILNKIVKLTEAIINQPYNGIGKPEPLKHTLFGCWSRKITLQHRYIYQIEKDTLKILSLKGHYYDK